MDTSFTLLEWYFNELKARKKTNMNKNADLELFESNASIIFNNLNAKICKVGVKLPYNYYEKENKPIYSGDRVLVFNKEKPNAGAALGIACYFIEKDSSCFYVETSNGTLNLDDNKFSFYPYKSYDTLYNGIKIGNIITRI